MYLVSGPIDLGQLFAEVGAAGRGGTTAFLGSVRRGPDDGQVVAIEYTAYEEMVEPEVQRILTEASERWPDSSTALRHRVGRVETGETSIAVVSAAPHRAEAFAACRFVVERVKYRVPVWKKEIFQDGAQRWRANEITEVPE